jgi:uncharacterized repeat protein (TIGR01451 family)
MKCLCRFQLLAMLSVALSVSCQRVGAQGFGLSVTASANSVMVSNSLTYTINVTNLVGDLLDAVVTNVLPASVQFQSATNYYSGSYTNKNNVIIFDLGSFPVDQVATLTVTAEPTTVGFITNTAIAASTYVTNTASASAVVQVTNLSFQADLGVTIIGPTQAVITNDWMTYDVTVTNAGPDAASRVMLTNTLPQGIIAIFPTNQAGNSNLIFNLGALASGSSTNLQFTVQPTNITTLTLFASVGTPGVLDPNITNNFASTNVPVIAYLSGQLVAVTNSAQTYNPQNGLIEQGITLSNAGPSSVPSTRVVVTGLTNQLFNAVGTNAGNPFVVYSSTLNSGQSVSLLLQYYVPTRSPFSFSNSQLNAFAVPRVIFSAPTSTEMTTNINITRIVELPNGNMLIEWPAIINRTYTVVYSDNVLFSNAMIAPPSVTAMGTRLQWVDYGPPTTVSAPSNTPVRFYRVFQNP